MDGPSTGMGPSPKGRQSVVDGPAAAIQLARLQQLESKVALLQEEVKAAEEEVKIKDEVIQLLVRKLHRRKSSVAPPSDQTSIHSLGSSRSSDRPPGSPEGRTEREAALARRVRLLEETLATRESELAHTRHLLDLSNTRLSDATDFLKNGSPGQQSKMISRQLLLAEESSVAHQNHNTFLSEELARVRQQLEDALRRSSNGN
eukprot:comp5747_c0_seq1/m.1611 comp5747_c0_seq1/g.1611  ORF comp5747_c0_seq1/g.1611 comp5747_c0_seq1/m.1611 type:complete len:203 (-) comp5747_c0_seq1:44-652(-)